MADQAEAIVVPNAGEAAGAAGFKDRKVGLMVFGIIQIILGALCALMVPFMIVGMVASRALAAQLEQPPTGMSQMLVSAGMYTAIAIGLIWLGIGSIKARRWARALTLVGSWIGLVSGVATMVFMAVILPGMFSKMPGMEESPVDAATMLKVVFAVTCAVVFVIYIVIPGAFVLFFGSRHTKATCEQRDPMIRWTDKCPLPVLAISLMFGLGALSMPMMGAYDFAMPCFGIFVSGAGGMAMAMALVVLCAWIAVGLYRLKRVAWLATLALTLFWTVSALMTFGQSDLMDLYAMALQMPAGQEEMLEMMRSMMPPATSIIAFSAIWVAIFTGYLFWIRKFFGRPAAPAR